MSHITRQGDYGFGEFLDQDNYLSTYLLDGSTINMAVDGSVTPVIYRYTVPANTRVSIVRSFITLEHGAAAFAPGVFAALGAELTNGVEISVTPSGGSKVVLELWKTNRHVRDTFFDFDQTFRTDGIYTGRWTFANDLNGNGIVLKTGDVFDFKIQDDLSAVSYFSFKIKGRKQTIA